MKMLRCVVCARRIVIYCVLFQMLDDLELTHAYTHQYIDICIYVYICIQKQLYPIVVVALWARTPWLREEAQQQKQRQRHWL